MNVAHIWSAATEAVHLLSKYPFKWLAVVIVFLVCVEGLMLIPYVGFVAKLMVAALVATQVVAMFAAAAAGTAPTLAALLRAFSRPVSTQVVLFVSALLPFAMGLTYLYFQAGPPAVEYFFGNVLSSKPPSKEHFVQFKYVMNVFALPFTFLAGAIVVKGLAGWAAIAAAHTAAVSNWLAVLVYFVMALALELVTAQLPVLLPRAVGGTLAVVLLVGFLLWAFAFTYTLSKRAFPLGDHAAIRTPVQI